MQQPNSLLVSTRNLASVSLMLLFSLTFFILIFPLNYVNTFTLSSVTRANVSDASKNLVTTDNLIQVPLTYTSIQNHTEYKNTSIILQPIKARVSSEITLKGKLINDI